MARFIKTDIRDGREFVGLTYVNIDTIQSFILEDKAAAGQLLTLYYGLGNNRTVSDQETIAQFLRDYTFLGERL